MESVDEPERPDRPLLPRLHRPRTISAGVGLLLAGSVLWLLVFFENSLAGSHRLAGLPLIGLVYLGCTIAVWHGGQRARIAVTVVTIVSYVLMLVPLVELGELSLTVLVLLTGVVLAPALVLIWHPASSLFIAEATAARRRAVEQRRERKGR